MPEGRPIVANCGSEKELTNAFANLLIFFVKPLSINHPSYIKDTYDFVAKIGAKKYQNMFSSSPEMSQHYTNMDIDITLAIIKRHLS